MSDLIQIISDINSTNSQFVFATSEMCFANSDGGA